MQLKVYSTTHVLDNVAIGRDFSDPVAVQELLLHKLQGIAVFIFQKKDGTLRTAIGTLNPALIPNKERDVYHTQLHNLCKSLTGLYEETPEEQRKRKFLDKVTAHVNDIASLMEQAERKKKSTESSVTTQVFYDLQDMGWKSFIKDNLLTVIDI